MIKKIIEEAFILKSKGFYKHAIEALYKALEYDNTSSELFLEIADSYYQMGEVERAVSYIEQILEKDSMHIPSLELLKQIFLDKNALLEATKTAENIYSISQNLEDFIVILKLLNKQKKYNEVIEYNIQSEDAEIFAEKAIAYLFTNNLEQAENLIDKALTLRPNCPEFLLTKGKILFKKGEEELTAEILKKISIDKNNSDMLNFAGLVEQQNGNYKKSVEYFLNAINLSPQNDEYYYNCASTYFKMNENALAKKYYNLAISLKPDNPSYHIALANLYYSEKQFKRALEELEYDFYEANFLKSAILFDSGYYAMAKKGLLALKEERPNDFMVDEYLNKIEEKLKF